VLNLEDATVTAAANSCTAAMTKACRDAKADYVLALKGNRGALHQHVKELFAEAEAKQFRGIRKFESHDEAHGRVEDRVVRAIRLGELPARMKAEWRDLDTAIRIERTRTVDGRTSHEVFYYVTNFAPDPELIASRIRAHWSIENQLHYCLDVAFHEDARSIHHVNGAQNFALIARSALVLLKREKSRKLSLAMKRRLATWSHDYLLQVLTAGMVEV
jgi:predicted transposase YbfD/YdcC